MEKKKKKKEEKDLRISITQLTSSALKTSSFSKEFIINDIQNTVENKR
ncbi:MAG: hypothetical protein ACJ72R_14040 [Nitrososphaeraceae archaeon]